MLRGIVWTNEPAVAVMVAVDVTGCGCETDPPQPERAQMNTRLARMQPSGLLRLRTNEPVHDRSIAKEI
jgi:hypothetical protein